MKELFTSPDAMHPGYIYLGAGEVEGKPCDCYAIEHDGGVWFGQRLSDEPSDYLSGEHAAHEAAARYRRLKGGN